MEKIRVLNQSLTQSPSLFDAPGTDACASEYDMVTLQVEQWTSHPEATGATPGSALLRNNLRQVVHTPCASVTKLVSV